MSMDQNPPGRSTAPSGDPVDVTQFLREAADGDQAAVEKLFAAVYQDLRKIAQRRIAGERVNHTLQATSLVNEAYLRLVDQTRVEWQNRSQFYRVAARAMRRILVDHARKRMSRKRGGKQEQVPLDDELPSPDMPSDLEILHLDRVLDRLAAEHPDQARVVELRFFCGFSEEETADALGVTARTVRRYWRAARTWLYHEMRPGADGEA